MAKEILIERFEWAVFTPLDVPLTSTFAPNRASAIRKLEPREGETWAAMKKRGWYSARIQLIWQKFEK